MYRVQLIFDLAHPDSEDQPVRDYLAQHDLEPRHRSVGEVEGRHCEVMLFGGCYLGLHLEAIGRLQRQAVEQEFSVAGGPEAAPSGGGAGDGNRTHVTSLEG